MGTIYIKGVTWRFGFDSIRILAKFKTACQKQGNNGRPLGVLYAIHLHLIIYNGIGGCVYICIRRGGFRVAARFDKLGNARSLYTVKRVAGIDLTFCCIYTT